ncbi:MAG: succinylglutamate desuccinylase/aspartoacylase family protein [Kiloniellales bacterium]|nr:succinylglutamate desuccinylase/aspartoacylase family protein [Kiloniellales bacterium]
MAASTATIACDLDFDRPGKQVSHLRLDHSDNVHAFGFVPIPIAVIAGGKGPTVLLTAGNHGDEYEGQVILRRLIQETVAEDLNGRLIVLPALNAPAVLAGTRVSPLDGLNLNRCFPGEDGGAPTRAIAHYVSNVLLPMSDAGLDLHSGGSASEYLPCSFLCTHPDPDLMAHVMALAMAFGAPYAYVVDGASGSTGLDPTAHGRGVPLISTELAGGASLDLRALQVGRDGVRRVLSQLGVLEGDRVEAEPPRFLRAGGATDRVTAPISGLFEPYCRLGEEVEEGDPAGAVHALEEPQRAPVELRFARSGVVVARRVPARVLAGDHVYQVAQEVTRDQILAEIKRSQEKP